MNTNEDFLLIAACRSKLYNPPLFEESKTDEPPPPPTPAPFLLWYNFGVRVNVNEKISVPLILFLPGESITVYCIPSCMIVSAFFPSQTKTCKLSSLNPTAVGAKFILVNHLIEPYAKSSVVLLCLGAGVYRTGPLPVEQKLLNFLTN